MRGVRVEGQQSCPHGATPRTCQACIHDSRPDGGLALASGAAAVNSRAETGTEAATDRQRAAPPEPLATRRLADIPAEPLEPRFGGRLLVGKLAVIAGPGGIGKSYLTMAVAAPVTRGLPLPGEQHPSPAGDVLVASFEDDPADTLRPRAEAHGADLDRVHVIDGTPDDDGRIIPFGPEDIPRLADRLDTLPDARMVIIDPVGAWVGAGVDIHRENEVRAALEGLRTLCAERRLIGWLVMHLRKAAAGNALSRILGAAAFGNTVRSVTLAGLQPGCESAEDGAAVAHIKHNVTAKQPTLGYRIAETGFEWTGEVDLDGETLAGHIRPPSDDDRTALAEAVDWLSSVLFAAKADGEQRTEVVKLARAEGITERTLARAAHDELKVRVKRDKTKRGCPSTWVHPAYGPTADFEPSAVGTKPLARKPNGADQPKHPPQEGFMPRDTSGMKPNQGADPRYASADDIARQGGAL